MNVYSSKEAVEFAQKALEAGVIAHIKDGYFRPLKDNVVLPNGDLYDIGSRFQVIGAVETPAEVPAEVPAETPVVEESAKEEVVEEAPVAKATRARKTAK